LGELFYNGEYLSNILDKKYLHKVLIDNYSKEIEKVQFFDFGNNQTVLANSRKSRQKNHKSHNPYDFIGTAKGYNTPRLALKLKTCFQRMPRGLSPRLVYLIN
jgi:hypothetical protein